MKSWEMEKAARDEGYHEGFDEGFDDGFNDGFDNGTQKMSQLIILLTEAGRTDDIIKAAQDATYRAQLFKEFGLENKRKTTKIRCDAKDNFTICSKIDINQLQFERWYLIKDYSKFFLKPFG